MRREANTDYVVIGAIIGSLIAIVISDLHLGPAFIWYGSPGSIGFVILLGLIGALIAEMAGLIIR